MTDLSPAIQLLIDYNAPRFAHSPAGFHEIRAWLNAGCDMQLDIVPTMKKLMDRNKNIGGLTYFRDAVYRARDARKDNELARSLMPKELNQVEKDANRAKYLAFAIRKLGKCMPTDERWLLEWEAAHGAVAL